MTKQIKKYYDDHALDEWRRLKRNSTAELEFETTLKVIKKYLPKKQVAILNVGSGPGCYAFKFVSMGHKVMMVDYSPGIVEKVKKILKRQPKKVKNNVLKVGEADVADLSDFPDNSFDFVLCLGGVLSHLLSKKDQKKAIRELKRVTKKGGYIFISVIGRLSVLKQELYVKRFRREIRKNLFINVAETGDYDGSASFTACHFFLAEDLKKLLLKSGLNLLEMVGLEGFSSFLWNETDTLKKDKKAWSNWLKVHYMYLNHPSVVDTSEHILAVCKK